MATTQTNSDIFEMRLKKGKIGEDIVRGLLEKKGWVVYCPFTGGAHGFDMMATLNKERAIALDVKAKSRMNKFNATGINVSHYETYSAFSKTHNMPFWLVFVDEQNNKIYGNSLSNLDAEYECDGVKYPFVLRTRFGKNIRLWHLDKMIHFGELPKQLSDELKSYNSRSYEYEAKND